MEEDLRFTTAKRREAAAIAAVAILQACLYQESVAILLDSDDDDSSSESEDSDSSEDGEESDDESSPKRCRMGICRPDYKSSCWWRMLEHKSVLLDKNSKESVIFRRRFRVPYPLSWNIVKLARKDAWLTTYEEDVGRRPCVPLELKVLGALQILGRGNCFDDISQMSLMSEETARSFFHSFCTKISEHLSQKWIKLPTGEDMTRVMEAYEAQGFPGALGSTDVTPISWDREAASRAQGYTGKEGYSTLAYEMTVDYSRRILAVTHGFPGAENDKSIVRYDAAVKAIRQEEPFMSAKYKLYDTGGNPTLRTGAYVIFDGGYHKCPFKRPENMKRRDYSTRMESMRKNGMHFRHSQKKIPDFKGRNSLPHAKGIDDVFHTRCTLHNMLLAMDGLDDLEPDTDWCGEDEEELKIKQISRESLATLSGVAAEAVEVDAGFGKLRDALVENFAYRINNLNVAWIKLSSLRTRPPQCGMRHADMCHANAIHLYARGKVARPP